MKTEQVGPDASGEPASARVSRAMSEDSLECWPSLIQSLKEKLDQLKHQSESLSNQLRQKNTRIRELEKQSVRKSRECLVKDVRDIMSELKTSEHNLGEVKKELASANEESINQNQKVNLYTASSIKNSQTPHLHISTLKQPCLKSTLELFPGNVTAS